MTPATLQPPPTPESRVAFLREHFGPKLQTLRKRKGLSQRALAKAAGIDHTYLSKIESGDNPPPSEDTVKALADALNADRLWLCRLAGIIPSEMVEVVLGGDEFRDLVSKYDLPRWKGGAR